RGDHSFVALYTPNQPIRYIAPSTSRDSDPAWSSDGRQIAFVRRPGSGGAPQSPLVQVIPPWAIMVADVDHPDRTQTVVSSGDPVDRILQNPGGLGFWWSADNSLVFTSYRDGWPHLYAIDRPLDRSQPRLLTPGPFMVEHVTITPDR